MFLANRRAVALPSTSGPVPLHGLQPVRPSSGCHWYRRPQPLHLGSARFLCCAIDGSSQFGSTTLDNSTSSATDAQLLANSAVSPRLVPQSASTPPHSTVTSSLDAQQLPSSLQDSWEAWLRYFEGVDAAADQQAHLAVELQSAVQSERYGQAATFKKQLAELQAQDTVAEVQAKMQAALAAEQYTEAARLRDSGLVSMGGWWAGRSGPEDATGHLLHIKAEYGRWTGRVYTARDVADIQGLKDQAPISRSMLDRSAGRDRSPARPASLLGAPVLELFVKPDEAHPGSYMHQAVALRPPSKADETRRRLARGETPRPQALPTSSVVRLSVSIAHDGTASIKALPSQPVRSQFTDWEHEEMEETLRQLRGDNLNSPTSTPTSSHQEDDDSLIDIELSGAGLASSTNIFTDTNTPSVSSSRPSTPAVDTSGLPSTSYGFRSRKLSTSLSAADMEDAEEGGQDDSLSELSRVAAEINMLGRDRFQFRVLEEGGSASTSIVIPNGQPPLMYTSSSVPSWAAVAAADERLASSSRSASGSSNSTSSTTMFSPETSYNILSATGSSSVDAMAPSEEASIMIEIPVGRFLRQQQRMLSGGSSPTQGLDATFDKLAERVARMQEQRVGRSIPRQQLAEAIRSLTQRLVAGEVVPDSRLALAPEPASASSRSMSANSPATTGIVYSRVATDAAKADPLSGLFLGAFGVHGPELVQLSRTMIDGEEAVVASKITGDPNIPAGEISFRAKIGRKHKLESREIYPDELGITGRWKGEGRVAHPGFRNARWVEGELLLFGGSTSALTGGAELGFVWSVPGEKRFLILLNKVDLKECEKSG